MCCLFRGVSDPADGTNDMVWVQEIVCATAERQRALASGREGSGLRQRAQLRFELFSSVGVANQ